MLCHPVWFWGCPLTSAFGGRAWVDTDMGRCVSDRNGG